MALSFDYATCYANVLPDILIESHLSAATTNPARLLKFTASTRNASRNTATPVSGSLAAKYSTSSH